mmetsp:Transcript_102945/g.266160  ORF Transcript_102945/g.266160 Transcript_102945/m.266160 type:complete len:291 (+) Transcript_102945:322-1194(+)
MEGLLRGRRSRDLRDPCALHGSCVLQAVSHLGGAGRGAHSHSAVGVVHGPGDANGPLGPRRAATRGARGLRSAPRPLHPRQRQRPTYSAAVADASDPVQERAFGHLPVFKGRVGQCNRFWYEVSHRQASPVVRAQPAGRRGLRRRLGAPEQLDDHRRWVLQALGLVARAAHGPRRPRQSHHERGTLRVPHLGQRPALPRRGGSDRHDLRGLPGGEPGGRAPLGADRGQLDLPHLRGLGHRPPRADDRGHPEAAECVARHLGRRLLLRTQVRQRYGRGRCRNHRPAGRSRA